ncbi:MAG: hypothetical protein ACRDBT_06270 [Aeromonas sp.]
MTPPPPKPSSAPLPPAPYRVNVVDFLGQQRLPIGGKVGAKQVRVTVRLRGDEKRQVHRHK